MPYYKPRRVNTKLVKQQLVPLFVVKVLKPFRHYMQTMAAGDYTVIDECETPSGKWYRLQPQGLEGLADTSAHIVWISASITDRPGTVPTTTPNQVVISTRLYTRQ